MFGHTVGKKQPTANPLLLNQRPPQRGKWHAGTRTDSDRSLNDLFSLTSVWSPHTYLKVVFYDTRGVCAMFCDVCHICDAISCKVNGPIFEVLNLKYEGVCLCACPAPSISTPMGQSVPEKKMFRWSLMISKSI